MCHSAFDFDPNRLAILTPLRGTAEVVPVVLRGAARLRVAPCRLKRGCDCASLWREPDGKRAV